MENLSAAQSTAARALVQTGGGDAAHVLRSALLAALCLIAISGVVLFRRLTLFCRAVLAAASLQCAAGYLLIWWWEPFNVKFWLLLLVPWLIVLACGTRALLDAGESAAAVRGRRLFRRCLLPLSLGMLAFNLTWGVLPETRPSPLQEPLSAWVRHSKVDDVLIAPSYLVAFLRYWENRPRTLLLYRSLQAAPAHDAFATVRAVIDDGISRKAAVLYTPAVVEAMSDDVLALVKVSRKALLRSFERYHREQIFSYTDAINGQRIPVYRLTAADASGRPAPGKP
jgi:hypothetical protein